MPRLRLARVIAQNGSRYLLGTAVRNWIRNFGSIAPALGSMTLLLFLVGLGGMAGLVGSNLAAMEARDASVLHVYLRDDASAADVDSLSARLRSEPAVKSVSYISKEEALARASHRPGLPELAAAAESNPFPASLEVRVVSVDKVGEVDASVRHDAAVDQGVGSTSYDPNGYQKLQEILFGLVAGGTAFLLLLAFIAVTVTANSIRAAIIARVDEISIMQLVGAPRWMVRGPFVIEGALTGAVAGLVAGALALTATLIGLQAGAASFAQVAPGLTLQVAVVTALLILLAGPLLGSASSLSSLRKHLES
jgi:cell division transport system permease protein